MLKLTQVSKRFADGPVLENVSFVLNDGQKVGLVGPNGSGKSTLLRLIAGQTRPSSGSLQLGPADRVAYLAQFPAELLNLPVGEALASALPDLAHAGATMAVATDHMADPALDADQRARALADYEAAALAFEAAGGYAALQRVEEVRTGLQLDEFGTDRLVATLSGGQKTRLGLARLLLQSPTILLLDEPTNYLDLPALLWLEAHVVASRAAAIIVSHDRRFLDKTVSAILELDPETRAVKVYPGTFSDYASARAREQQRYLARYHDQVQRIDAVQREITTLKGKAASTEQSTIHFHYRKVAKGVARRAKVQERRLERFLASEERLDRPEAPKHLFLEDLTHTPLPDIGLAVAAEGVACALGSQPIFTHLDLAVHGADRLALVGPNGSGKTTLLRLLAGELAPDRGRIRLGAAARLGYLPQEHHWSAADGQRAVIDLFRDGVVMHEDEARAFLDKFLFSGPLILRRLAELSYGERVRLALARLVASGANALLLDEPTSHLDVDALERIEAALAIFPGPLVVASHDRYFLDAIGITGMITPAAGGIRQLTSLEEYAADPGLRAAP